MNTMSTLPTGKKLAIMILYLAAEKVKDVGQVLLVNDFISNA